MYMHEIENKYRHNITVIKDAAPFAAMAIRKYREKKAAILSDGRYSDQGKAEQVAAARDEAKADLDQTFEHARDAYLS